MVYWASCISFFLLINISNLSITKYIFDWDVILTCFKNFLNYLRLYLTGAKDIIDINIVDIYIESVFIGGVFIKLFSIMGAFGNTFIEVNIQFSNLS